jgi:hypothetical protein
MLLLLSGPAIAVFVVSAIYIDSSPDDIYNDDLENKIVALTKSNPDFSLVVAGDSRAERQVMPTEIEKTYDIKTINIATSSCDVVTTYKALKKYKLLEKPLTIIVSSSFCQVNDGAIEPGYVSMGLLVNLSLIDKVVLFRSNINELRKMYFDVLRDRIVNHNKVKSIGLDKDDPRLKQLGFLPVDGSIKLPIDYSSDPETTKHHWYKNINIHGARWKALQNTLKAMSEANCRFVIYQPTVSDAFKEHVKDTPIDTYEEEYCAMLEQESKKYKNIYFLDYYSKSPKTLTNEDYYEPQHLNQGGAKKFTSNLMNDCIGKLKLFKQ